LLPLVPCCIRNEAPSSSWTKAKLATVRLAASRFGGFPDESATGQRKVLVLSARVHWLCVLGRTCKQGFRIFFSELWSACHTCSDAFGQDVDHDLVNGVNHGLTFSVDGGFHPQWITRRRRPTGRPNFQLNNTPALLGRHGRAGRPTTCNPGL